MAKGSCGAKLAATSAAASALSLSRSVWSTWFSTCSTKCSLRMFQRTFHSSSSAQPWASTHCAPRRHEPCLSCCRHCRNSVAVSPAGGGRNFHERRSASAADPAAVLSAGWAIACWREHCRERSDGKAPDTQLTSGDLIIVNGNKRKKT